MIELESKNLMITSLNLFPSQVWDVEPYSVAQTVVVESNESEVSLS